MLIVIHLLEVQHCWVLLAKKGGSGSWVQTNITCSRTLDDATELLSRTNPESYPYSEPHLCGPIN